ncbi:hypothetical protein [Rhizobium glycinendophyticum]|nr:hypothetical protein [Rhizobium glycinendophyticum]
MSRPIVKKNSSPRHLRLMDASGRCMAIATTSASIAFLAVLIVAL